MREPNEENETEKPMSSVRNDNNSSFEELYNSCFAPVFRYVYYRLKSREEAEDLTQNVFLRVHEKNNGNFSKSFVFTIARNLVIDHWKKKKEVLTGDMSWFAESIVDENNPVKEIWKKEDSTKIKKAISELSDECQEVITLKFLSGLTNKEISVLINKKEDAIRQMQVRSLRKMRGLIYPVE